MSKLPSASLSADDDRISRVAAAVELVRRGDSSGSRVSVRKAALIYNLPKSTVHRYIQASRGVEPPRRRATSSSKRTHVSPPKKCGIRFLLADDIPPQRTRIDDLLCKPSQGSGRS